MAWVATGAAAIGAAGSIYAGNQAAGAAGDAADTAAQAEQNKLNYLQETEEQPQYYRENALSRLGEFYGITSYDSSNERAYELEDLKARQIRHNEAGGSRNRKASGVLQGEIDQLQREIDRNPTPQQTGGQSGQQGLIADVQASPFYDLMISQGEEAIGRGASMTGGLRSGNTSENLAQNSQNVLQGMVGDRLRGLNTMSQLPSNANAIGNSMSQVGNIQALGQVAGAQATQQGWQGAMTGMGQAAGAYLGRPQPMQPQNPTYGYGMQPVYGGGANPMPEDYGSYV